MHCWVFRRGLEAGHLCIFWVLKFEMLKLYTPQLVMFIRP